MLKVMLWIIGTVIVVFAGLVAIGYTQEQKAKSFIEDNGGKDVRVGGSNDRIMCHGGIGLVVAYKIDGKEEIGAVCVGMMSETHIGTVR